MFKQINSMPAKVCLGICALVSLIYSLNFMLFADCYVIGGDDVSLYYPTMLQKEPKLGVEELPKRHLMVL